MKIFFNLYILSFITSSSLDLRPVEAENVFQKFGLSDFNNSTQIVFDISNPSNNYMVVELLLSHPSKYETEFNYIEGKEVPVNLNIFESEQEPLLKNEVKNEYMNYFDEELINPERRILLELSDENSDLIEKDDNLFGKRKVLLKLKDNMNQIALSVTPKDNAELKGDEILYAKYKIIKEDEKEKEKYYLKENKVKVFQNKDMLNISFAGVQKLVESENVTVDYSIKLFDKKELESKFENIYIYVFDTKINSLFSTNIKLKGVITSEDNHLVIKAPLNNKTDQLLLVNAKVKNKDEENEENLLQYEVYKFKVEEISPKRKWEEEEDPKKKNRPIFIIILACFLSSVLLTLILVLIYTKLINKQTNIEEDKDYKDVGGIVDEDKTPKDDKRINEEED